MQQTTGHRAKEGIISSETVLTRDQWIYRWQGAPPGDFCLHKVLFHHGTPAEIAARRWQVLEPAVTELVAAFRLPSESVRLDWLKLDAVPRQGCLLGVHADETVVAAAPESALRRHFLPYRFYESLAENGEWRNLRYSGSFRHFTTGFDTGVSFLSDQSGRMCDVDYQLHFGVHGVHSLWSTMRIDNRTVAVPHRFRVSESLRDLPGKVERITRLAQAFVGRLGSSWLGLADEQQLWSVARGYLNRFKVPAYKWNELKTDPELTRCHTKLDMLLFLAKVFQADSTASPSDLLHLAKSFIPPPGKRN